ncbi:UNVERIFIED_CONTAM: hypothetical protein K2H54_054588 [Gekko kuhli]
MLKLFMPGSAAHTLKGEEHREDEHRAPVQALLWLQDLSLFVFPSALAGGRKYCGLDAKFGDIEQWMEDTERYNRKSRRYASVSDEDERMSVGSRGSLREEAEGDELWAMLMEQDCDAEPLEPPPGSWTSVLSISSQSGSNLS